MKVGRVLRTGLSSLRDRAAARLAALRFNPSRIIGYTMLAVPLFALASVVGLSPLEAAVLLAGCVGAVAYIVVTVALIQS